MCILLLSPELLVPRFWIFWLPFVVILYSPLSYSNFSFLLVWVCCFFCWFCLFCHIILVLHDSFFFGSFLNRFIFVLVVTFKRDGFFLSFLLWGKKIKLPTKGFRKVHSIFLLWFFILYICNLFNFFLRLL